MTVLTCTSEEKFVITLIMWFLFTYYLSRYWKIMEQCRLVQNYVHNHVFVAWAWLLVWFGINTSCTISWWKNPMQVSFVILGVSLKSEGASEDQFAQPLTKVILATLNMSPTWLILVPNSGFKVSSQSFLIRCRTRRSKKSHSILRFFHNHFNSDTRRS